MPHTTFEDIRAKRLAGMDDADRTGYDAKKDALAIALRAGMAIRDVRETAGLTQTQLAARMGVAQSSLARIEAGRTNITLVTLTKIAKGLGTQLVLEVDGGSLTITPSPRPVVVGARRSGRDEAVVAEPPPPWKARLAVSP
jgi:transcriptional regulator with XRE-family HTH domain